MSNEMEIEKLMPCPFCGSRDVGLDDVNDGGGWAIRCWNCRATGPDFSGMQLTQEGKDFIAKAWNTRVMPGSARTEADHPVGCAKAYDKWIAERDTLCTSLVTPYEAWKAAWQCRKPEREIVELTPEEKREALAVMLSGLYGDEPVGDPSPARSNMQEALSALLERFEIQRRGSDV